MQLTDLKIHNFTFELDIFYRPVDPNYKRFFLSCFSSVSSSCVLKNHRNIKAYQRFVEFCSTFLVLLEKVSRIYFPRFLAS